MIGIYFFNLVQTPAHVQCTRLVQVKNVISLGALNKHCQLESFVLRDRIQSIDKIRIWISDNTSVERIDSTIVILILVFYITVISIASCSIPIEYVYRFIFPEQVYIIVDITGKNITTYDILAIIQFNNLVLVERYVCSDIPFPVSLVYDSCVNTQFKTFITYLTYISQRCFITERGRQLYLVQQVVGLFVIIISCNANPIF